MKRFLLAALLLAAIGGNAAAQRISVSSNLMDWLLLGTLNARGEFAVAQHWSAGTVLKYNPWTFRAGHPDTQMQLRPLSRGITMFASRRRGLAEGRCGVPA